MFSFFLKNRNLFPLVFFLLLVVVFFWKFFFLGLVPIPADVIVGIYYPWRDYIWNGLSSGIPIKNALLSDVISIIYPWRIYGMELIKNGQFPLWIPHTLSGSPLLANFQSGLLYPLNFLFFIFSNVNAWSIYIMFQPFLAALFCYLFLKNLKLKYLPSLVGSVIFAFSGFSLVWLEYGIIGHAGLWLPLILLSIDKIFEKFSFRWLVVGSLSVSFSIFAGYPQISFLVFLIAILYTIFQTFLSRGKGDFNFKPAGFVLIFFLLGILISFPQLIIGVELWGLSIRQADPTAAVFNFGLNPLKNLILLVAPDFFGNPTTGNFWGWGYYNESVSYVSVGGIIFAIFAFLNSKNNKNVIFFSGLFALSLLLVFANPFSSFIYNLRLPVLASSSAGRFLFITDFSLAILAAYGAQFLLSSKKAINILHQLIPLLLVYILFLVVIFLKPNFLIDEKLSMSLSIAKRNLILPTIFVFLTSFLIILSFLKIFSNFKKIILFLVFILIVFDLFRFGWKYNPFVPNSFLYPKTELTTYLQEKGDLDRFVELIPQSAWIPYDLFSLEGYDALMIKRYNEVLYQMNEEKYVKVETGSRWVKLHRLDSHLLDLLGVKYILSYNSDPVGNFDHQYFRYPKDKYKLVFQYGKSQIYENLNALPRAFIIHQYLVIKNDDSILKTLVDKNFDFSRTLVLEENPKEKPEKIFGEEKVEIDKNLYIKNKVVIRTTSAADGFLFLSDNYFPGWKAFVDGRETRIYRANYTFRAIFLPKGEHQIMFIYSPLSFKIGLYLSLATLLLLVIIGICLAKFKKELL